MGLTIVFAPVVEVRKNVISVIVAPEDVPVESECLSCCAVGFWSKTQGICPTCTAQHLPLPWEDQPEDKPEPPYTVLDALHELKGGRKGVLMIIHNKTNVAYQVLEVRNDGCVRLKTEEGAILNPHLTQREDALYHPFWR